MEHLCSGCAIFVWFIFQFKSLVCFSKPTKSTIRSWVHIFLLCLEALSQFLWTFTVLVCIFQVSSAICDTYLLVSYWCTQFAGGTICLSYNTRTNIVWVIFLETAGSLSPLDHAGVTSGHSWVSLQGCIYSLQYRRLESFNVAPQMENPILADVYLCIYFHSIIEFNVFFCFSAQVK